jgi:hypothetical protein
MDSAKRQIWVELTGSGSAPIDVSRAVAIAVIISGENAASEKSFIVHSNEIMREELG